MYLRNEGMYRQSAIFFHMSPQYGELRPTTSWDRFTSLSHLSKCQRVSRHCSGVAHRRPAMFARCLAVSSAGTLYRPIHFRGLLPPGGILPGAKFTLRPSLAFFIGSVTARYSNSGRQPNCGVVWNYGSFADGATYIRLGGHHVGLGHRPTF